MSFAVKHYILHFNVLTLIVLFLNLPIPAQNKITAPTNFPELKFEQLNVEHGLSQGVVFCILQDQNGFMWFGTESGLNKYNHETDNFTRYLPDENKENLKINVDFIGSITQDYSGRVLTASLIYSNAFRRSTVN